MDDEDECVGEKKCFLSSNLVAHAIQPRMEDLSTVSVWTQLLVTKPVVENGAKLAIKKLSSAILPRYTGIWGA